MELDEDEFEPEDEELEPEEEWELVDDPLPPPELDDDDPDPWSELWDEEPELPALRVAPASASR